MRRSRPSLLEKQGIKIMSGAKVVNLDEKSDSIDATNGDGKGNIIKVIVDRGIAAVGVIGNVGNIGVEKLCLKIERGTIAIDDPCQTSVLGIYAIGDVAGPPMLAHKAEHEGVICIEAIKGLRQHPIDEHDSRLHLLLAAGRFRRSHRSGAEGQEVRHPRWTFPFAGNGKAVALGEDQGMVKTAFDRKTDFATPCASSRRPR